MRKSLGFTLAELLIVVAIMAVLVGVAIPIFGNMLERTRETTDAANIRSEYAHIMTAVLSNDYDKDRDADKYKVQLVQLIDGWQTDVSDRLPLEVMDKVQPTAKGVAKLTYDDNNIAVVNLSYEEGQAEGLN